MSERSERARLSIEDNRVVEQARLWDVPYRAVFEYDGIGGRQRYILMDPERLTASTTQGVLANSSGYKSVFTVKDTGDHVAALCLDTGKARTFHKDKRVTLLSARLVIDSEVEGGDVEQ